MGHLGVVLYEYLGEEYPEVLGSILGALKVRRDGSYIYCEWFSLKSLILLGLPELVIVIISLASSCTWTEHLFCHLDNWKLAKKYLSCLTILRIVS